MEEDGGFFMWSNVGGSTRGCRPWIDHDCAWNLATAAVGVRVTRNYQN